MLAISRSQFDALAKGQPDGADPCIHCDSPGNGGIDQRNTENKRRAEVSAKAFSGQQHNKDTCALMSAQSVALEAKGSAPPEGWSANPSMWGSAQAGRHTPTLSEIANSLAGETDMIDIGKASGAYSPCNGTTDEAKVLTQAGVPATLVQRPSLADIGDALDQGKAVNVAFDARPIWYGSDQAQWPPQALGHTVRVTGVDRGVDGQVRGFYINDSGTGVACQYVPASNFQSALDGFGGGRMAVSNQPIQPAVY